MRIALTVCIMFLLSFFPTTKGLADEATKLHVGSIELSSTVEDNKVTIPLRRVGNLFLIEAKIDTTYGNFVLDLGAPYLVLNSTYFRDFQVDHDYYSGTLLNDEDFVRRADVDSLKINSILHTKLLADVINLGQIENARNVKILGLLGVSLFKDYVMEIDVVNQQLILYQNIQAYSSKQKLLLEVPIKVRSNVILLKGKSSNVKLLFSLDSGAESNILDNDLPAVAYEGMKIKGTTTVRDAHGGRTEVVSAEMNQISIADVKLGSMNTLIMNLSSMSRAYNTSIDGMLGYPFFEQGTVVIDFENKILMLYEPNKRSN